ncbi:MAG: DUF3145 family protein [Micrococcales bacterium]
MGQVFTGSVLLHSVPRGLLRPVLTSISRQLGYEPDIDWQVQPESPGGYRAEVEWSSAPEAGAAVSSALAGWKEVWFEVVQPPQHGVSGSRWLFVPGLGLRHRHIDEFGNYTVGEQELLSVLNSQSPGAFATRRELQNLLAHRWELALEPLRACGADSPAELRFRTG